MASNINAQVRAWAIAQGLKVSDRGIVAAELVVAWVAAGSPDVTAAPVAQVAAAEPVAQVAAAEPVKIAAGAFVKIDGAWFIRTLPGDAQGSVVEVPRRNRAAAHVKLTSAPVARKIGAQVYMVAESEPFKVAQVKAEPVAAAPVAEPVAAAPVTSVAQGGKFSVVIGNVTVWCDTWAEAQEWAKRA